MDTNTADESLMAAVGEGGARAAGAFELLYARHKAGVQAYISRALPGSAEDLTQEVFLRLWIDPAVKRADRATPEFLVKRPKHQSLFLVRPIDFRVVSSNDFNPFEGRNQQKRRACFTYRGQDYSLGLTDPIFTNKCAAKFPQPDGPAIVVRPSFGDQCLLCVSLTPVFNGYHYKVVATVLKLP